MLCFRAKFWIPNSILEKIWHLKCEKFIVLLVCPSSGVINMLLLTKPSGLRIDFFNLKIIYSNAMISYWKLMYKLNYYTSYRYKLIREIHQCKIIRSSTDTPSINAKCRIQSLQIVPLMSLTFFWARVHLQKNVKKGTFD